MNEGSSRVSASILQQLSTELLVVAFLVMFTVTACSSSTPDPEWTTVTPIVVTPDLTSSVIPTTSPAPSATSQDDQPPSPATAPVTQPTLNPTAIPISTALQPAPTATLTATPSPPTLTPEPSLDDRFGLIASGPARDWQVQNLGSTWFIDFDSNPGDAPPGTNKVPFIQVTQRIERTSPAELALLTAAAPGSYWYIGGEPNVPQQGNMTPEAFVDEFDYYATEIRAADPTARIMGPSILNWDFTCTGCAGFRSGESWMRSFIDAYAVAHGGASPPVDVWSIDAYPLTWDTVPMTNWQIVRDQILGFRQYLADEVPGHSTTPIWVTELASHWAFSDWIIDNNALAIPSHLDIETNYLWDEMEGYMDGILGWLKDEGPAINVDRWFFFKGHVDIESLSTEGYAGIYFYENGDEGSPLNHLGEVYNDYISGRR